MPSNSNIMSIQEMIDAAFGEANNNVVNFKLLHSILYILARQLRLLQRRVEVEISPFTEPVTSTLLVTEVKLRANVPKKKKKLLKTDDGQKKREIVSRKSLIDNAEREKSRTRSVKSEVDKSSELTTSKSSDKTSSKSTTDKTTTSSLFKTTTSLSSSTTKTTPVKSTTDKSSTEKSSTDKTSTQQSSTEKSSTEKSSTDKTSTQQSSTEKSYSDRTKSPREKSPSDMTKLSTEKSSSDRTKSSTEKSSSDRTKPSTEKSSLDRTQSSTEKSSSDRTKPSTEKPSLDRTKPSTEKSSLSPSDMTKLSTEKSSSDRTKSSTEKSSSDRTKPSTEKSSLDRTKPSTEKSSLDRTQSSTEKSSSDRTKPSTEKSSLDKTKPSTEKSSLDRTQSSTEKSSSDRTKPSTEKSSLDRTQSSTEKSSSDRTKPSTEKSSLDRTQSLTEKSSSDRTKSSTEKSSSDRTKSSTEKSSSDRTKSSTEKSSSDRTKSSTEKSSSDRTKSSSDRTSTKESSDKISSEDFREKLSYKDYHHLLDKIEQQREQELRVVNQRADSREEAKKILTPMTSLDEMEEQYEKLLIVERVPTDTDGREKTDRSRGRTEPPLSIVTQDQFDGLAELVIELQEKFGVVGKAEFPENIKLMQDLRRGASLTDAMAALQLSARIEAAEKTLEQMMSLVTDLAVKKGIDVTSVPIPEKDSKSPETEVLFGAPGPSSQDPPKISYKSPAFKQPQAAAGKSTKTPTTHDQLERISIVSSREALKHIDSNYENIQSGETVEIETDVPKVKPDWITAEELDEAIELMYDSLFKSITLSTSKSSSNADTALKIASRLERKIDDALNLDTRMDNLETLVSEYAGQINTLDTGLSSYMTDYQEQLTQMQHDLEGGLESMAEAMANTGGDTAAVAELNSNITNLQMEFDTSNLKQKKLKDQQSLLFVDLENLWKQIEILRGTKSDREEAADALRDKAGLGALNGLISQEQFDAVRGDFEKRIGAAYDKFNNQEIIWQKAIDDILRELNEKADWLQVSSLRNDVNDNLDKLRSRINEIMEIVGEPRSAAVTKKLFHDTACLSCATPAYMNLDEPNLIPALPAFPKPGARPATIGTEDNIKTRGDGDHGLCYPGQPIPHPLDPRSHVCHRYCGGSHTTITGTLSRAPVGMIITPALRRTTTEIGSDGRVYMTDEPEVQSKPCLPCALPKETTPQPSLHEDASTDSASPSLDFLIQTGSLIMPSQDCVSDTPPPPLDD